MDFSELQTEFYARGFDYLNQDAAGRTRAKRWLNEGYLEDICADEPWDFLRTSSTETAPIEIADLDTIISVKDVTNENPLFGSDASYLEDTYADLTETGTAVYYYFTGDQEISVFPADTGSSFTVRYFKVPDELSADADEPLVPSRFQGLIVDAAVVRGHIDSDNFEAAALLQARFDARLDKMRNAYMVRDPHPRFVQQTGW